MFKTDPAKFPIPVIQYLVDECKQLSDAQPDALHAFAEKFVEAHARCPGGMTIEVGTRFGGSALLFAKLLDYLYVLPPPLITIAPYGAKVYEGGDHEHCEGLRPYTDPYYVNAKNALANFPNHSHFTLESMDFFNGMKGAGLWRYGVKMPFRKGATFVFLDGNHDAKSITDEVEAVQSTYLKKGGLIVIDNARNDPRLPEMCTQVTFFGREWAFVG